MDDAKTYPYHHNSYRGSHLHSSYAARTLLSYFELKLIIIIILIYYVLTQADLLTIQDFLRHFVWIRTDVIMIPIISTHFR